MKLNCGLKAYKRHLRKTEWHPWFAWHPVEVRAFDCRWLEWVERKGEFVDCGLDSWWQFEYRLITP